MVDDDDAAAAISRVRVGKNQLGVDQVDLMTVERESTRDLEQHAPGDVVERVDHREIEGDPRLSERCVDELADDALGSSEPDPALQLENPNRGRPGAADVMGPQHRPRSRRDFHQVQAHVGGEPLEQ